MHRNWNNLVDIMTMQRGGRSGVRLPTGSRSFSLRQNVPTATRAHEAFHPLKRYRAAVFPQGNRMGLHLELRLRMSRVVRLLLAYFHAMDWENFFLLTASTDFKISDCLRFIRYLQHNYELTDYHEYIKTNNYKFLIGNNSRFIFKSTQFPRHTSSKYLYLCT